MAKLDNISVIQFNDKSRSSAPIQKLTKTSVNQPKISCSSIRNRKFLYILVTIVLIAAAIIIPTVLVFNKNTKPNKIKTTTTALVQRNGSLYDSKITNNTKWKQNGITVVQGISSSTSDIYIDDDDETIYTVEFMNHRVMEWKDNETHGRVVAGGNGEGDSTNQLKSPATMTVDKKNNSIIICDQGNRRIVRWSRQNAASGDILIYGIDCYGLVLDNEGYLYVSNFRNNEVRRWTIGVNHGIIVAGGYNVGNDIRQLNWPTHIFVDADYSVYVSDSQNHRIMKRKKDDEVPIVAAGGQGYGNGLAQLQYPLGVVADQLGNVYVVDYANNRVMRWLKGATQGSIVVGGNGLGNNSNQFVFSQDLSFDKYGNLYVIDGGNNRIQKFYIDSN